MAVADANCGNRRIDGLAATGHMRSIWDRLEYMFPMVKTHAQDVWIARKDGRIRRTIERDTRFSVLLANPVEGPQSPAEWQLLAIAALSAIGREPCEGELENTAGIWIGMPADHPTLKAHHAGCAFCADGWKPCPTQGYPMGHV